MSIELHTVDNGNVQAINDGRLYSQLTGAVGGIVAGANCSSSGGLVVSVTSGWGIASGRVFTITAENYTVTPSPSGTRKGRLYVKIDLTDASEPIKVLSITGTSLPALVQQDLSNGGTVYEIELAHYDITTLAVSNLVSNTKVAFAGHAGTADNANKLGGVAASEYMPKSGGNFNGTIYAGSLSATDIMSVYARNNKGYIGLSARSDMTPALQLRAYSGDGSQNKRVIMVNQDENMAVTYAGGTFSGDISAPNLAFETTGLTAMSDYFPIENVVRKVNRAANIVVVTGYTTTTQSLAKFTNIMRMTNYKGAGGYQYAIIHGKSNPAKAIRLVNTSSDAGVIQTDEVVPADEYVFTAVFAVVPR